MDSRRAGDESVMTYSLPNLYYTSGGGGGGGAGPLPVSRSGSRGQRQRVTGTTTDTTLALLIRDRTTKPPIAPQSPADHLKFNTMRYPDRKALYLLGQTTNDAAAQKWLNKLIARREQRNSQFLERLKMKQTTDLPPNSRNSLITPNTTRQPPHRNPTYNLDSQRNTPVTPATKSRVPHTTRPSYPNPPPKSRGGGVGTPGWFNTEQFLSQSTGVLPDLNSYNPPTSSRGKQRSNEITVDLTKENTHIAHRLLGAYMEKNPTPLTRTFMNIGEAPVAFVDEFLQERILEKLDCKSLCALWLSKLVTNWDIREETPIEW